MVTDDAGKADEAKPQLNKSVSMTKGAANEEIDTRCGYLCCKPGCLQRNCNTARGLGIAVILYTTQYGITVLGLVNAVLVTLSRRYGFTNSQIAWIPASQDLTGAFIAVTFGYIGTYFHKGRLLMLSALGQCFGSFLFILVHFISPTYELGAEPLRVCDPDIERDCGEEATGSSLYFGLMIVGQISHGLAGGILWCVACPYMDENMKAKNTPLYVGYMYGGAAFGTLIGYVLGGLVLSIYVDIGRVDMGDIDIEPGDPRWVGAWWIPFIIGLIASLTCAIYIGSYPKQIPDAARYQAERKTEAYKGAGIDAEAEGTALSNVWQSIKIILSNPPLVFLTLAGIFSSGIVVGFTVFLPAVLTFQFDQNPAEAAVIAGLVIVPAAVGGYILGGFIPQRLNLTIRGLMKQTLICTVVVFLGAPVLLLRCDVPAIAGINRDYVDPTSEIYIVNLTAACNAPCACDTRGYDPLCGKNNVQYFSPCHAACLSSGKNEDGKEVFYDCMCIPEDAQAMEKNTTPIYEAVAGQCPGDCIYFYIFLAVFFVPVVTVFMSSTSGVSSTMRAVPETERSFAMGLQATIIRVLGNVPFPILMGTIFDNSCLVWQYTCAEKGSCWVYDTRDMAIGLTAMSMIALGLSSVCHLCAVLTYKPPPERLIDEAITYNEQQSNEIYRMNGNSGVGNPTYSIQLDIEDIVTKF